MKTSLTQLRPALEDYDFAVWSAREIPSGFNQHFEIRTSEGLKHLIIYRPQHGKPPRDLQFQMQRHVIEAGFTLLPKSVPTASGRPVAKTRIGTVAVVDWVPGHIVTGQADEVRPELDDAACVLADLHLALRDFRPPRVRPELLAPLYQPADFWVQRAATYLADLQARGDEPPETVQRIVERLDRTIARWHADAYAQALEDGTSVVHGDFRPGNLIVDDGRIVAVVDFDAVFWEARVYDLAYAAFQFSGPECVYPQASARPAQAFVRDYVERWPLSSAERALLPFFLRQVVLKRLLTGRDVAERLALLDQLDAGLEDALVGAAGGSGRVG